MPTSARLEVANSPQITVKNGAICRVDVGIGPYKKSSVFLRTPTILVREMRLELTRRLPHAPQTCLSTYSSTLAYNFRLLSYYTHSFCICQVFYFFLAGCSITFLLALRPDIWYNTSCMYTKEGGRGGCRSFLFRRTMCAEAF